MDPAAVSNATSFDYAVALDVQVPLISEAGFTHFSLGANESHSNYLSTDGQRHLGTLTARHGLAIDTIHGPRADQADSPAAVSRAVNAAAELGVPILVVHGSPFDFPEAELTARLDQLVRLCEGLVPVLAKSHVRLALENVLPGPATELIRQALDVLDPLWFGFCYDSSHDQIGGPRAMHLLAQLRHRLIAVQLSDRIRDFVDHVIPGEGFIQWPEVCGELAHARYDRPLLLEVLTRHSAIKEPREFLRIAHRQGLQLAAPVHNLDEPRELQDVDEASVAARSLLEIGYMDFGVQVPGRRLFTRGGRANEATHHLHFVVYRSPAWYEPLQFRDKLRGDPILVQKYAQLKRELAARYGRDVREYSKGKTDFVASVLNA